MFGPSGFFLPADQGNAVDNGNDVELIHTSEGGFNSLYRVCKNGRFFVYKALKEEYRGNLMYEDLLTKDFNIGFTLNHPNICQYYAKIQHPSIGSCIVMEWIDGQTLEELLNRTEIADNLAQKIICEICDSLEYIHCKQVIHRDLKPANILITHNGQNVKLIDFGLSDTDSYATFKSPAGTRLYAAPELIAGETADTSSDIWSLGMIINEISSKYRNVAERCLRRNRHSRYSTAAEVKLAILKEKLRKIRKAFGWVMAILIATAACIALWMNDNQTIMDQEAVHDSVAIPDSTLTNEIPGHDEVQTKTEPIAQQPSEQKTQTSETPAKETPVKETITTEELEDLFNSAVQSIL